MIKEIVNYHPQDIFEIEDKKYMVELYDTYKEKLFTRLKYFHFTASSFVFNETFTKVLFIYHKIYDSWGWMGGHMDGCYNFYDVAKKEVFEESGAKNLKDVFEGPVSIEVLPVWYHIKDRKPISSHMHLNVTYAFFANDNEPLRLNEEETNGVKWIPVEKITDYVTEPEMLPIYIKIIERVQNEKISNI